MLRRYVEQLLNVYNYIDGIVVTNKFGYIEFYKNFRPELNKLKESDVLHVPYKDKKAFAADLRTIYLAPNEEQGRANLARVTEKWSAKYPNAMKSWEKHWDVLTPIYKFSADVRKVIYTTNAIESLNSTYKKLNRQRSVFPSDTALLKSLYLSTLQATRKWNQPLRNWAKVYGEFSIMYDGRLPI